MSALFRTDKFDETRASLVFDEFALLRCANTEKFAKWSREALIERLDDSAANLKKLTHADERQELLSDNDDPSDTLPNTLSAKSDPVLVQPTIDSDEPTRPNVRHDSMEPR
jgi:hypothetical protein